MAAAWAAPAAAADPGRPVYAPVPAKDPWNAFTLGVGGVGNFLNAPTAAAMFYDDQCCNTFGTKTLDAKLTGQSFAATAEVGKDFHINSTGVVGLWANYDFGQTLSPLAAQAISNDTYNNVTSLRSSVTLKPTASVGARAGFLLNPGTLIYGLLGYSWADYTSSLESYDGYNSNSFSKKGHTNGVTVGLGAEMMLTDMISVKGEYRLTRFKGQETVTSSTAPQIGWQNSHFDLQQVRLTLGIKLN